MPDSWKSMGWGSIAANLGGHRGLYRMVSGRVAALTVTAAGRFSFSGTSRAFGVIALNVVGKGVARVGTVQQGVRSGDGFVFDGRLASSFSIRFGSTAELVTLWLPVGRLVPASVSLHDGFVLDHRDPLSASLCGAVLGLARNLEMLNGVQLDATARALSQLVTLVLDRRSTGADIHGARRPSAALLQFIDENLLSRHLTPERVAAQFAMSRATLYRQFESLGGIAGYIRERRLFAARNELVDKGRQQRQVAAVGRHWGFGDASGFARAYRQQFGVSPSDDQSRERRSESSAPDSHGNKTLASVLAGICLPPGPRLPD